MNITKHRRDVHLLMLQFGAALAVSFAGFLYSRLRKRRRIKPSSDNGYGSDSETCRGAGNKGCRDTSVNKGEENTQKTTVDDHVVSLSQSSEHGADEKDVFLLPEFDGVVTELDLSVCKDIDSPRSDSSAPIAFPSKEEVDHEKEIMQLRNTVRALHERERNLEEKLLEYYSLKEQQKVATELRNRLKLNQMETKVFNLKIKSLQAENERLEAQLSDHAKVVLELEAAKSQIQVLKQKLQLEAQRNRDQILSLRERVAKLQEQEIKACLHDPDADKMMQRLKDLEAKVDELTESNTRLQIEKSELAEKLESAQLLANSKLEDPDIQASSEEGNRLRRKNEELKQEIEQLQADRCTDLEELVYLRWINACLRYELRNYQPPAGKTVARDLSTTLSPKSEEKAKKLILEYAQTEGPNENMIHPMDFNYDQWSSSPESLLTDSGEWDDSSIDTSLASKTNKSGKHKLITKLRKVLHGKDVHRDNSHGRSDSPERWVTPPSTSSAGVPSTPQLRWRHSMDFQMLMRNKAELKGIGIKHQNGGSGGSVYRTLPSCSQVYREDEADSDSEQARKSELLKFAEVFRQSRSPKKFHKKSVSYCL